LAAVAEYNLVDLAGPYAAPVEDALYHNPRKLFGRNAFERAADPAHRRATGFNYYYISHLVHFLRVCCRLLFDLTFEL
jgi:hypothetical protein